MTPPPRITGQTPFPTTGARPYRLTLPGYGSFWFRLNSRVARRRTGPGSPRTAPNVAPPINDVLF